MKLIVQGKRTDPRGETNASPQNRMVLEINGDVVRVRLIRGLCGLKGLSTRAFSASG